MLNTECLTKFSDLARHMRSPEVHRVFDDLRWLIDPENKDLFVHTNKVRHLTKKKQGAAVVTLVVDDYEQFQAFLQNKNAVEWVRYSEEASTDSNET